MFSNNLYNNLVKVEKQYSKVMSILKGQIQDKSIKNKKTNPVFLFI